MTVSVVIPTFNGKQWIGEQLDALANQEFTGEWELIVADNGSTDGTRGVVERWRDRFPMLRLLDSSSVRGQSHARNRGALAASGDHLLFTDDDDIVCSDWIARMTEGLADAPMATGPVVHFVDGQTPSWGDIKEYSRRPSIGPFDCPTGCNLGIWRKLFLDLGGFDEGMTRSWEDVDLGIRATLRGSTIGWVEHAVVLHRRPGSERALWDKEYSYGRGWTKLERRYPQISSKGWAGRALRRAGWVAVRTPYVASPTRRRAWIVRAAGLAGSMAERFRPSA